MAWRDAMASKVRLLLFMSSLVLGIAAVVAIQLFSTNLKDNLQGQSKALMGADYIIDADQQPMERAQEIIDSLKPDAYEVNFVSMAAFPKNQGTKLVKVRAIEGDFPFYGAMETQPADAASKYQSSNAALVDATLMLQFRISPGDSIKIGNLTLPIAGALKSIPGTTAVSTSVAPTVLIPNRIVDQTGLLQFGSRREFQYFFKASDTLNLDRFEDAIDPQLDRADADLDTHKSDSERLGKRYENISKFLNLTAFIALILGCIGIASSVHIYIKEKLGSIAMLKCLGASRKQTFLIFLIQIAAIGLLGGIIGTLIGAGLQTTFPYILKGFLPFEVEMELSLQPLLIGIFLGLSISVLFATLPLLKTWFVSPLQVVRVDNDSAGGSRWVSIVVFFFIILILFLFTFWLLEDALRAFGFVVGTLATFAILAAVAAGVMRLIKKYFPINLGFTARQSLLNLYRPNNQTVVLVVAIGLGTFLVSTLYFTKDVLLAKTDLESGANTANMIILDVQSEQRADLVALLNEQNAPVISNIPIVTMRMDQINSRSVKEIEQDSTREIRGWVLNHEFRTTYRDSLTSSETLLRGSFDQEQSADDQIKISISDNLAKDALLDVGDPVTFNIQGVLMKTVVGSIRQVDWSQLNPNFSIVFPAGILEDAPQFNVVSTAVVDEEASARLQRELVSKFPNVTVIDLRQVFNLVEDILSKISWVINFMAFFSILTGLIVLIGSVRTSKYQRIKENVLLRTLGAKNNQILKITALEYVFLGILGSLVGILLALLSTFLLALFIFQETFVPSWIPFFIFLPSITLIVLFIGLSNIREVLNSSPLQVLRRV
ncbi:MAG: FtsX-like permease family protein [Nonlabens sp.]